MSHPLPKVTATLAVLTMALGLAACKTTGTGPLPTATIPAGKILTIGYPGSIQTLNPITMVNPDEMNAANFVWQGLLGVNARGSLFPIFASTVPSVTNGLISDGGRRITFNLRPDLKWSDGHAMTAADVRFGWHVAVNKLADLCPETCWDIRNVRAATPRQVVFQLRRPFSPLLFKLPPILPRHYLWQGTWKQTMNFIYEPTTSFFTPVFPVDGPFEPEAAGGNAVVLVRNPYWNVQSRPYFDEVDLQGYADDPSVVKAQENNPAMQITQRYYYLDFSRGYLTPRALSGLHLKLYPVGSIEHLEPNLLGHWVAQPGTPRRYVFENILGDLKVRQALNLAIDRSKLLEQALGLSPSQARGLTAYSPESNGRFDGVAVHGAWDPIKHRFMATPQLRDAKLLLGQAGWHSRPGSAYRYQNATCDPTRTGCELQLLMLAPAGDQLRESEAPILQSMLQQVGIHVVYDDTHYALGNLTAPYVDHGACSRGFDDLCLFAQVPGPDPQTDYQLEFTSHHIARKITHPSRTDLNYPGIRDPFFDQVFKRAAMTYNLETRRRLYRAWQIRSVKNVDWITLYQRPLILVTRGHIRGLHPSPQAIEWDPWALAPG